MLNDFIAQTEHQHHERELVERLERRRIAAERSVQQEGSRLAVVARLAREGRVRRPMVARPAGC